MSEADIATAILDTATAAPPSSPEPVTASPDQSATPVPEDTAVASPPPAEPDEAQPQSQLPTTAQIRSALKAFRDANPDHSQAAKLLNDGYSRYEAYKEVFPTVDDARSIKAQLDTLGGVEGIAEMQSIVASIDETDALLDAGDPKILDQIIEDSPEGFKRLAPHYVNRLQKLDPEAYTQALQPHFVRALADAGLPGVLNYLASKLSDNPDLLTIVNNMQGWFEQQKSLAERFQGDITAPDREKLQTERSAFEKERRKSFEGEIARSLNEHVKVELGNRLRPYVQYIRAMPRAAQMDIANAAMMTLFKAMEADKTYQTQVGAMFGSRKPDAAKINAINRAKVTALADAAVASIVKGYGLKPGAATKAAAGAKPGAQPTPVSQALTKVSAAPKESEIDWGHEHMNDKFFIQHRAVLTEAAAKARGLRSRYVQW